MESMVLEMYQAGNWSIAEVRKLVPSVITAEQFTAITGQNYITVEPARTVLL